MSRTLDLVDCLSLAGDRQKPNEDRFGSVGNRFWVIDGATDLGPPLLPGTSDAAWIADLANRLIAAGTAVAEHRELVARVVTGIASAHELARLREPEGDWQLPNAAFLLAEVQDDHLDVCWLGDCRLILATGDRLLGLGEDGSGEAQEREMARSLSAGSGVPAMQREGAVLEDLRRKRARLVAPGGPRVLGVSPDTASHLRTERIRLDGPLTGLAMTDGFSALELKYGRRSSAGMLAGAVEEGLARLAVEVRAIEELEDPDGRIWPRFKRSDDATAVLLRA